MEPFPSQLIFFISSEVCLHHTLPGLISNSNVWFHSLILWIGGGNRVSRFAAQAQLVMLKEVYPWIGEVNSQSLQYAIKQCADGFRNWWEHCADHPVPKRKDARQSFHNPQHCSVDWKHGTISVPKCKDIKAVLHRPFSRHD